MRRRLVLHGGPALTSVGPAQQYPEPSPLFRPEWIGTMQKPGLRGKGRDSERKMLCNSLIGGSAAVLHSRKRSKHNASSQWVNPILSTCNLQLAKKCQSYEKMMETSSCTSFRHNGASPLETPLSNVAYVHGDHVHVMSTHIAQLRALEKKDKNVLLVIKTRTHD